MAEIAIAGLVIQLADVAIRGAKGLSSTISALKSGSAELNWLHNIVTQFEKLLTETRETVQTYHGSVPEAKHKSIFVALDTSLRAGSDDLQALKDVLGKPLQHSKSAVNRFGKIVKSVYNEKELRKLSLRLYTHQTDISILLSSLGR